MAENSWLSVKYGFMAVNIFYLSGTLIIRNPSIRRRERS
jgi:hypothetical protein